MRGPCARRACAGPSAPRARSCRRTAPARQPGQAASALRLMRPCLCRSRARAQALSPPRAWDDLTRGPSRRRPLAPTHTHTGRPAKRKRRSVSAGSQRRARRRASSSISPPSSASVSPAKQATSSASSRSPGCAVCASVLMTSLRARAAARVAGGGPSSTGARPAARHERLPAARRARRAERDGQASRDSTQRRTSRCFPRYRPCLAKARDAQQQRPCRAARAPVAGELAGEQPADAAAAGRVITLAANRHV
jgi:hypothetical protein